MPPEFVLLSQLGGPLVGAAIAFIVMYANQKHQAYQDVLKDARALRDAKRARLAGIYETALIALVDMDHFISVLHLGQFQDEQWAAMLRDLDLARARLMVEPAVQPIAEQFEQLFRTFTALRVIETERIGNPQVRFTDVQRRRDEFDQGCAALRAAIHASLNPLDEPVHMAQLRLPRA